MLSRQVLSGYMQLLCHEDILTMLSDNKNWFQEIYITQEKQPLTIVLMIKKGCEESSNLNWKATGTCSTPRMPASIWHSTAYSTSVWKMRSI